VRLHVERVLDDAEHVVAVGAGVVDAAQAGAEGAADDVAAVGDGALGGGDAHPGDLDVAGDAA
jgi:hypothetical protein